MEKTMGIIIEKIECSPNSWAEDKYNLTIIVINNEVRQIGCSTIIKQNPKLNWFQEMYAIKKLNKNKAFKLEVEKSIAEQPKENPLCVVIDEIYKVILHQE